MTEEQYKAAAKQILENQMELINKAKTDDEKRNVVIGCAEMMNTLIKYYTENAR